MPKGTRVDKMYRHLLSAGMTEQQAAREAQRQTGLALRTGRRPKNKGLYDGRKRKDGHYR